MRKLSAQLFLRSPRSMDRLDAAVVWERDDQMSGPSGGLATPVADGDGRDATPCPLTAPNYLHAVGRVAARDGPPVVFLLSRKVACREVPSNHPGAARLRAPVGDGVDPRGSVAAVPTAQADRECCQTHPGMRAWMGQHLSGFHTCLTPAGVARRDEHPRAVGVVTQPPPGESPPGPECSRTRSWRPRSHRDRRTGRSR